MTEIRIRLRKCIGYYLVHAAIWTRSVTLISFVNSFKMPYMQSKAEGGKWQTIISTPIGPEEITN